ncbi:MAG: DUF4926 domain-containing protein [Chloroflexi bacterium]|nr:DUF4926 domain-containing protein [Chloroflexota bacterium]
MKTIKELDEVVLVKDLPEYGLRAGDIGTVVLVHRREKGYEVEFVALDGETIAAITLMANEVRPIGSNEIAHARAISV